MADQVAFWCHDCFERVPIDYEHAALVAAHIGHRCEYVGVADIEPNPKGKVMFLFRPSSVLSAVAALCEQGTLLIEDIAHQLDRRGL